jgi:hypothetical protein
MRVLVSRPSLVPDLVEFLARIPCDAGAVHGPLVDVTLPGADAARARRDLDLYLAAWRALHPPVEARVLDEA